MKKIITGTLLTTFVLLSFFSCKKEEDDDAPLAGGLPSATVRIDSTSRADAGGSGVMLQGFTWSSPSLAGNWYSTISSNASDIKDLFEYVWFPPASDCVDPTGNGYLPRELNKLTQSNPTKIPYYGSESDLKQAISDIKPAKAIADIVINHRCGTTGYGDFTNPSWDKDFSAICKDDEGFTVKESNMYGARNKGAADSGESYSAGRDIDHTNLKVQTGIVTWLNDVMKKAGFAGWRYDYVKGYNGIYNGFYNARTEPVFSVGEYWPTGSFNGSTPETWSNKITGWISETAQYCNGTAGKTSRAFDFVLKGMLNEVFGCGNKNSTEAGTGDKNYAKLANEYNIYKKLPGYSVTFVDNHDTGSTQKGWYLNPNAVAQAYAFTLTHPGYPCVAWYHYFAAGDCPDSQDQYIGGETVPGSTLTYKNFIKKLVKLRAALKITDLSKVDVIQADNTRYSAEVKGDSGSAYVVIGTVLESAPAGYTEVTSGTGFQIFKK